MRRMITTKQIEFVNKLQENINETAKIGPGVNITRFDLEYKTHGLIVRDEDDPNIDIVLPDINIPVQSILATLVREGDGIVLANFEEPISRKEQLSGNVQINRDIYNRITSGRAFAVFFEKVIANLSESARDEKLKIEVTLIRTSDNKKVLNTISLYTDGEYNYWMNDGYTVPEGHRLLTEEEQEEDDSLVQIVFSNDSYSIGNRIALVE